MVNVFYERKRLMKRSLKRILSAFLASVMVCTVVAPVTTAYAQEVNSKTAQKEIGDYNVARYNGDYKWKPFDPLKGDKTQFTKISHPLKPVSSIKYDPLKGNTPQEIEKNREEHKKEVFTDGLIDYVGNNNLYAPTVEESAGTGVDGQPGSGDRGQTYSWAAFAYGDWMYVSTLYNSTESTARLLMGHVEKYEDMDKGFGGDLFVKEYDDEGTFPGQTNAVGEKLTKAPGSTLCKINVKTGEVKIIMSQNKNGLETSFRNAVEYHGKLYFCGSVNHLPSIYEIDPETDSFKCVYQDPSIANYPTGPSGAYAESMKNGICPTIRGIGVFKDWLVISTVGLDGNPYIAVSQNPSEGFTKIAESWKDKAHTQKGELYGYPACRIPDGIMGGSIWEMVEFNGSLYVAIVTGTPDQAKKAGHTHQRKKMDPKTYEQARNENGELLWLKADGTETTVESEAQTILDEYQPFALVRGDFDEGTKEHPNSVDNMSAWTWTPIIGDKADGAKYTFGIDPERTRSVACNLKVYKDKLYIGEYNETQMAFKNMEYGEFDYVTQNMAQSVSLYSLDKNDHIEKVMGDKTKMFPTATSGINKSGWGRRETQYIWQSKIFQDELYFGSFDETMILKPVVKAAMDAFKPVNKQVAENLASVNMLTLDSTKDAAKLGISPKQLKAIIKGQEKYGKINLPKYLSDLVDEDSPSPLPNSVVKARPVVKVRNLTTLYQALMAMNEVWEGFEGKTQKEQLVALSQYVKLHQNVVAYLEKAGDDVPQVLRDATQVLINVTDKIDDIGDLIGYMGSCIDGFDLYKTKDGKHFTQITRSGMGDPYNQGLRAFAANDSKENPWLAIGTANPFYGTQIWRMDANSLNQKPLDPKQKTIKVKFVYGNKVIPRNWDTPNEINVNEDVMALAPDQVSLLWPDDCTPINPKEPIPFVDGVLTIPVNRLEKNVAINYVTEDGRTVGNANVSVSSSTTKLSAKVIAATLPEGYALKDPVSSVLIKNNGNGCYVDAVVRTGFTVSTEECRVINPSKDGVYGQGNEIKVYWDKSKSTKFDHWEVTGIELTEEQKTANPLVFTMPANNVSVKAVYNETVTYTFLHANGKVETVTINSGEELVKPENTPTKYIYNGKDSHTIRTYGWEESTGNSFVEKATNETVPCEFETVVTEATRGEQGSKISTCKYCHNRHMEKTPAIGIDVTLNNKTPDLGVATITAKENVSSDKENTKNVKYETEYTLTAVPNENAEFVGWYSDGKMISTETTYKTNAYADTVYEAVFTKTNDENEFTVTFMDEFSNVIAIVNSSELATLTELPTPYFYAGLTFENWSLTLDEVKALKESAIVVANYKNNVEVSHTVTAKDCVITVDGKETNDEAKVANNADVVVRPKEGTATMWQVDGKTVAYGEFYKFHCTGDIVVTFANEEVKEEPVVTIIDDITDGKKIGRAHV